MRNFLIAAVAATSLGFSASFVSAQNQVERRADRNLRQVEHPNVTTVCMMPIATR